MCSNAQTAKRGKATEKQVTFFFSFFFRKLRLIMTCHHALSVLLRHLKVLFESLLLRCHVPCAQRKRFAFFNDWLIIVLKSMLGSKTWRPVASLRQNSHETRACSISSALCLYTCTSVHLLIHFVYLFIYLCLYFFALAFILHS